MSFLTNPYALAIIELNKEIAYYSQLHFTLKNEFEDYKRNPVETVSINEIMNDMILCQDAVISREQKILKISKFIGR